MLKRDFQPEQRGGGGGTNRVPPSSHWLLHWFFCTDYVQTFNWHNAHIICWIVRALQITHSATVSRSTWGSAPASITDGTYPVCSPSFAKHFPTPPRLKSCCCFCFLFCFVKKIKRQQKMKNALTICASLLIYCQETIFKMFQRPRIFSLCSSCSEQSGRWNTNTGTWRKENPAALSKHFL